MLRITATIVHTLRLKCTKFDFGWGSASDPTGSLVPLSWTWAPLLRRGEGRGGKGMGAKGKGWDGRGGEENGKGGTSRTPPTFLTD